MSERPTRSQAPEELKWDVTGIYPNNAAWEEHLVRLNADSLAEYEGRLRESAETLLACLQLRDVLEEQAGRVTFYAHLHQMGDGSDPANLAMVGRASAAHGKITAAASFIEPELLGLPDGQLERYAQEPVLRAYSHQLRALIRRRPHVLSREGEAVLSGLSQILETPFQIYQQIVNADLRCESVADSHGTSHAVSIDRWLFHIAYSSDREFRRRGYASLMAGLRTHQSTLGANLINHVRKQVDLARLRRFGSAAEMLLFPDHLDVAFYRRAVDTLLEEARPVARQLLRLRKRLWGVDRLYPYDLTAPLLDQPEQTSFAEAGDLLRSALEPLGQEYVRVVDTALRERWVDRADNRGRFPLPISTSQYGVHPFIMTTWTDKLSDVMLLSHELGHTVHSILINRNQSIGDSGYGGLVAETASTANEWLCYQYLSAGSDQGKALAAARCLLEVSFANHFSAMLLIERLQQRLFDLVEAGKPVAVETVLALHREIWQDFYGDELVLEEENQMEWALYPHLYFDNCLYPYSYAVAMSASFAITTQIRAEGASAAERWLTALKAGATLPPLAFWRTAGVEMDTDEPLRQAVRFFGGLVEKVSTLLAQDQK
ncbi:M3 family metallopeptidase [Paenibacillus tianmuensis]|nr:M3 family metallopeptidase [Paenibacillus tianmuensis]